MSEGDHLVTNNTSKLFFTFTKNIVNSDRSIRKVGISDRMVLLSFIFNSPFYFPSESNLRTIIIMGPVGYETNLI